MLFCAGKGGPVSDSYLKRQLKWHLLTRVVILSLLLGVSSIIQARTPSISLPPPRAILIFILSIYAFSIGSAAVINRLRRCRAFAYAQILADTLFVAVIVYSSGGSQSIFTFMFLFPVISAGLLLLRTGALLIASVTVFTYAVVLSSEYVLVAGRLPIEARPPLTTNINVLLQHISVYGLSFFLVAILSALLACRLRQTEEALSRSERDFDRLSLLYKQIFDDISSGIITVDAHGGITSFNQAAELITGYAAKEVLGRHIDQLFTDVTSPAPSGQRPIVDITRKDGRKIPVGYSWTRLNMPDGCEDCRVYTLQDLSKIKKMEEQVKQSEKMAAIGEIAAGIAHEFRNPLAAISGAAQVLGQDESLTSTNRSLLNIIRRECARLESNIGDFLQFSKPAIPEKRWLSLATIVAESWEVINQGGTTPDNCRVEADFPDNLDCWADQHQIKQVFINLLHNSCQAMAHTGGIIRIHADEYSRDGEKTSLRITVSDQGCGMDRKTMRDIWQPFFTTRENGTGLGLAIVRQIIEGHGGRITVKSAPHKGTVFSLYLPLP